MIQNDGFFKEDELLRRVDALIGEHLFGFQWRQESKTKRRLIAPAPIYHDAIKVKGKRWDFIGSNDDPYLPRYTVEPAHAWAVLMWILNFNDNHGRSVVTCLSQIKNGLSAQNDRPFSCGYSTVQETGGTAEIAVCKHALKLKGVPWPYSEY